MYKVEFYSTKSMLFKRQYRWRIVHRNGNIIAISSEGYYNRADRNEAFYRMIKSIKAGYAYEVCRSIDQFMEVVNEYLT